jgi:outer membrane murein-binding lipoprotein Lpp
VRRLGAAVALVLLLAGCSASSPKADLQSKMNAITDAANASDPAGLRAAVGQFEQEVTSQGQNADITSTQAQRLRALAELVMGDAALLEASPSPAPSSAAPSPSASPSPSPSPSPTPPPSPSPEPTQPPSPDAVPSVQVTTSPGGLLGGDPSPSP